MTFYKWSKTAATNATADATINWAEGMPPSAVNDSGRAMMAATSKYRDDISGALTTAGTSTAYTLTSNQVFTTLALMDGATFTFYPNATSGAAPTLNVDGLGAKSINYKTGTAVPTAALISGSPYRVTYYNATTEFILHDVLGVLPDSLVTTAAIAPDAVTYARLQNVTATNRLLGRATALAGDVEEITIGAGLTLSSTTLLSAFPPPASFKNLSIKVASTTTVTVAADFVTTTDATTYQTTAVSSTVNLGTTGADALDAGTIATSTWYAIWVIAKSDGTTKCLASTSATAPTMPTGYTFKARIGWVRTISGTATLYGTWQLGRRTQYIVGLAQTTVAPIMISGVSGTPNTPTWTAQSVSSFVPTTASRISLYLWCESSSTGAMAAPNASYGPIASTTNPPPLRSQVVGGGSVYSTACADWLLESTNVYFASSQVGAGLSCLGWEDNI